MLLNKYFEIIFKVVFVFKNLNDIFPRMPTSPWNNLKKILEKIYKNNSYVNKCL